MVIPANLPRHKAMSRVEKPNPFNPGNSAAVSGGLTRSRASETVEGIG